VSRALVDLFAGAGGFDVAAAHLGIRSTGIELDPGPCATRRAAGLKTIQGDVREYGPANVAPADVLVAGPPCQTYSIAGKGSGRKVIDDVRNYILFTGHEPGGEVTFDDERTALVIEPLRWVVEAIRLGKRYKAVVLEQVPQVLPIWEAYEVVLQRLGYTTDCGIVSAECFGVPQTRKRAVLIAKDEDGEYASLPAPTHQAFNSPHFTVLPKPVSMGNVLHKRMRPFYTESGYNRGGITGSPLYRYDHEPYSTITGKCTSIKVIEGESRTNLTLEEAGILQTFPPNYPWMYPRQRVQVGNAVPPLLAIHLLAEAFNLDSATVASGIAQCGLPW
jgi:DNA (cytosine-5)-methyltransferase 1